MRYEQALLLLFRLRKERIRLRRTPTGSPTASAKWPTAPNISSPWTTSSPTSKKKPRPARYSSGTTNSKSWSIKSTTATGCTDTPRPRSQNWRRCTDAPKKLARTWSGQQKSGNKKWEPARTTKPIPTYTIMPQK